jgi:hypothetical protein
LAGGEDYFFGEQPKSSSAARAIVVAAALPLNRCACVCLFMAKFGVRSLPTRESFINSGFAYQGKLLSTPGGAGASGALTRRAVSRSVWAVTKRAMPSPAKKKKLSYPDETEGSRLAAEIRRRANKLTKEERRQHFQAAMRVFYGAKWPKETARG